MGCQRRDLRLLSYEESAGNSVYYCAKGASVVNDDQPVRKKRRKLTGYYVLIVVVVVVVGGFALFRWRLKSKLQRRMDAIRTAGYPVTCIELDEWYSLPDDVENAADVILEAVSYYREPNRPELIPVVGQAEMPGRTEALSEETVELVREYLASNKRTLDLLGEAAGLEHSRYPVDFTAGFNALMPYLSEVREMARLQELEAILHAEEKAAEATVESVERVFGVARSLAEEPALISELVRVACQGFGVSAIERAVNRVELGDERLTRLSRLVVGAEKRSGFLKGLVGERCMILDVFRDPKKMDPQVFGAPRVTGVLLSVYKAAGLTTKGAIVYLDFAEEFMQANRLAEHRRIEAAEAIEAKLEEASGIHVMMVRMLMPAYARVIQIDLRSRARMRAAAAGLAIERYRLARGELPDTLGELVPAYFNAVPRDPFDGAELRYKRLEKGFVVYSVGEDGSDDGGRERNRKRKENWDETFIVER